jgi:AhpD family alkylhydroperoxidase
VALEGYLNFSAALAGGSLDNKIREQIAIAVAESNLCLYCMSAHAFLAEKAGLSPEEIASAVRASSSEPRIDAVLKLARTIIVQRGEVSDAELERARVAGLTDGELVETVANTALSIFTNYLNHLACTPVDFPEIKSSGGAK